MNFGIHEKSIAQRLKARGLSGLFEPLLSLKGLSLNQQFTLNWLYAVGGQSVLYYADNTNGQAAIVKLPLLHYHRAAYISIEEIQLVRRRLQREATLLHFFDDTVLPKFYELVYSFNPLHPSVLGEEIVNKEPYLIMEFVQGQTLLEVAHTFHRLGKFEYNVLEYLVWSVLLTAINFSIMISKRERGYLYSDFSPHNFLVTHNPQRQVRILDAGSIIPHRLDSNIFPPFTPVYVPIDYYKMRKKGQPLWPTNRYIMYSLGKMMWEVLTNRQPNIAKDPDFAEPMLKKYSESLRKLLVDLIEGRYDSFEQIKMIIEPVYHSMQDLQAQLLQLLTASDEVPKEVSTIVANNSVKKFTSPAKPVKLIKICDSRTNKIQVLRYSPDGQYLAIGSGNRIELRDASTLRLIKSLKSSHKTSVTSLDFDFTGQYLASSSGEGTICLWQIDSYEAIWKYQGRRFNGQVALNGQGDLLAASTDFDAITFYPQRALQKGRHFTSYADQGTTIALAKQLPLLAVGGHWGLRLWNLNSQLEVGKETFKVGLDMFVQHIAFGSDDQVFAASNTNLQSPSDSSIIVWDLLSCKLLWRVELPNTTITDFRLSSKGRYIFASALDGRLWIWAIEQKAEIAQLKENSCLSSLDFDSNRLKLTSATLDGGISIYHLDV